MSHSLTVKVPSPHRVHHAPLPVSHDPPVTPRFVCEQVTFNWRRRDIFCRAVTHSSLVFEDMHVMLSCRKFPEEPDRKEKSRLTRTECETGTKNNISLECREQAHIKLPRKHSPCLQEFPPVTQLWVWQPVVFISFQQPSKDILAFMSRCISVFLEERQFFWVGLIFFRKAKLNPMKPKKVQ